MVRDSHLQPEGQKWQFDESVTAAFPEMLQNSIPGYDTMRWTTTELASRLIRSRRTGYTINLLDLGASRGDSFKPLLERFPELKVVAYECSDPMRQVLASIEGTPENPHPVFSPVDADLRTASFTGYYFDIALSILTLMFVPPEHRLSLLQRVYNALIPGGAFFIVEKTLCEYPIANELLFAEYEDMKRRNGYTDEQITRKKLSLEGVLMPFPASTTENMLKSVGFREVQSYWRTLQFCGWVCIK